MIRTMLASAGLTIALPFSAQAETDPAVVLETYADIAQATYEDSLATALSLEQAIAAFLADPTEDTLAAAREAWRAARVPYQQSEAYRFGNAAVDDWEGKVNAWPLDEGLIDYVDAAYGSDSDENAFYTANVIANESLQVSGRTIDASTIDASLIQALHEVDDVEANVATGYHAIEFLLWGQDLHGTDAGSGERPATDYSTTDCTNGNCDRRAAYLSAATELLISDLEDAVAMWSEGGEARAAVTEADAATGLTMMLTGLGSLTYGELAGERIMLGLMLHDPEEEHDCFSDNTHMSHYYDQVGIMNVYQGRYERVDGSVVEGPSLSDLVAEASAEADAAVESAMDESLARLQVMVDTAEGGKAYDQMLAVGDDAGNQVVQDVVDALTAQASALEGAIEALGLDLIAFEGSDSLDDPEAVFQ